MTDPAATKKKFRAVHVVHTSNPDHPMVQPGEELDLSDADAEKALASGAVVLADAEPDERMTVLQRGSKRPTHLDGSPLSMGEFTALARAEFERALPFMHRDYLASFTSEADRSTRRDESLQPRRGGSAVDTSTTPPASPGDDTTKPPRSRT
jgi:hypothetical protein